VPQGSPPLTCGGAKLEQELKTIFEAQQIDTQVIENERKLFLAPRMIAEMDAEIEAMHNKSEKEKAVVQELEKERRKKEKELEVEKEKIAKFESKLYDVKTNKEYQALLKEIESAKEANDKTEEEILLLMDKAEEIKKDYETLTVQLKKREAEVEKEKDKLNKELESVDKMIRELKTQRDNLLSVVSAGLRETYTTLIVKRGGLAVVNLKNGVCQGCYMNIPPQLFIEATKNRQLILCPSCNRIFYFLEEER
jgi:predicted  nucleic acid-binding Zn-ribbon protein